MGEGSRRARRAWVVALVVWVAFVWGHSLASGDVSGAESGLFVGLLRPLFAALGVTDPDLMSFVVRKCAHFTEYAILGVIVVGNVRSSWAAVGPRSLLFVLVGVAVPFVDESIQLLVPGRAGMLRDVLIDLSGLACGLLLAWLVAWRRGRLAQAG